MTTTLLGVDDSKTMRKVIEITFAGEDFKTVLAENADDALSKLHAERPSVALVDAGLDGTNGYELCHRLKAATPNLGVILLSSKQQPYDRNRGMQVGADDFIDKPFDTQQLIDKVNTLLRKLANATAPAATAPSPAAQASPLHGLGPSHPAPRAGAPEQAARPRAQTLAYGQQGPQIPGGTSPVAPVIPAAGPPLRSSPMSAPAPAPMPSAAPVPRSSPTAAPAPVAARQPAAAPPPKPALVAEAPTRAAAAAPAVSGGNGAEFSQKLAALGLTAEQVSAVVALSREVVEQVVWEVVPTLAETLIREEIRRLTSDS